MNEHRMQFAIGVVTLMAGFALAAIIIWFGEFQFVLQPRRTYYVLFTNAPGAAPKVPVRRAGIRIGEVTDVTYSDQYSVVVLSIELEGSNELFFGDIPTLNQTLPFGQTYLDIDTAYTARGKRDREPIPPFSTLEGKPPFDAPRTIESAAELVPTGTKTLKNIDKAAQEWTAVGDKTNRLLEANEAKINQVVTQTAESLDRLQTTLDSVNSILDPASQENLRVTLQNVRDTSEQLKPTIEAARQTIEKIAEATDNLNQVATNLQQATKPLAEHSASTMKNLDESAASLNALLAEVRQLLHIFRSQDGTIQQLLTNPTLFQNLDDGALLLVQNLAQLEAVMKDLRVFADKIARHPGDLGLPGVLKRDDGLKDVEPGTLNRKPHIFRK